MGPGGGKRKFFGLGICECCQPLQAVEGKDFEIKKHSLHLNFQHTVLINIIKKIFGNVQQSTLVNADANGVDASKELP